MSPDAAPLVYAVVLNWNQPQHTIECVRSLLGQQPRAPRLLVVDNGSTDNSVEVIRHAFPEVELIAGERNLGFAGGVNVGIRRALAEGAQYVLLVNNDAIADPSMLDELLACAQADGAGVLAPAIYYVEPPDRLWFAGGRVNPLLLESLGPRGRIEPLPDAPTERDFLAGCALLVRREVFEAAGLFDERFFMYYEDLDFCLRVRRSGYRLLVVPRARLWHKVAQSSGGAESPQERYLMALSSGRYFRKHMRGWQPALIVPYRLLSALRWTVHLAWWRRWAALSAYWRGLVKGWLGPS